METKLQEEINELPVIHKAHIYEPKIEDVAEISFKAGETAKMEELVKWVSSQHCYTADELKIRFRAKLEEEIR